LEDLKVRDCNQAAIFIEADDFSECAAIILEGPQLDDLDALNVCAGSVALRGQDACVVRMDSGWG
jgi:hypothetical protein